MFFDHSEIQIEINMRKIFAKFSKAWKLHRYISESHPGLKNKSKGKSDTTLNYIKMKTLLIKVCEMQLKQFIEGTL